MHYLGLTTIFAAILSFGLTLTAGPPPAEAGLCKKLDFSKKCVVRRDIKKNAINSRRVKDESLTSADIKDGSIGPADLAPGTALGLEGVAVIGPGDFHGSFGDSGDDWGINASGFVQGGGDAPAGCVAAPVHLPDGVTITEVELVFVDDSAGSFAIELRRASLLDGGFSVLAFVSTNGIDDPALMRLSDTDINQPFVDAVEFNYHVRTSNCIDDSAQRLYAVRIFY